MKKTIQLCCLFAMLSLVFVTCKKEDDKILTFEPTDNYQEAIEEAFITVEDGFTIHLKAGTYKFTKTLSIQDKTNVTIKGDGTEQTILDFSGQTAGAESIKGSNLNMFLIHDLAIIEAGGVEGADGIKIKDSDGLSFINLKVDWPGDVDEANGAYGLYPVSSKNVLVDNCHVRGASDAGVYVGQCEHVIVRNCTAEFNVAGIEIENCNYADVYGNLATHNTGGLLVFDMPNLPLKNGRQCRVYDNQIIENDYRNFAPEGNIVGQVPSGTGIMLMTSKEVEIFNNIITDNNTMGLGIVSYEVLAFFDESLSYDDPLYEPYPRAISIHDNTFSRTANYPAVQNNIGVVLETWFLPEDMPDIIYDGLEDPNFSGLETDRLCITNNGNATFADVDVENYPFNQQMSLDPEPYNCQSAGLPAVSVTAPEL